MKPLKSVLLFICVVSTMLCLSGCFVQSYYPYFTEESIQHNALKFTNFMLTDKGGKEVLDNPGINLGPYMRFKHKNGETEQLNIKFFKAGKTLFLDVQGFLNKKTTTYSSLHSVGTHVLYRVDLIKDRLNLTPLSTNWFIAAAKNNRITLPNVIRKTGSIEEILFTAKSEEWMKFLEKNGENPDIYDESTVMTMKSVDPIAEKKVDTDKVPKLLDMEFVSVPGGCFQMGDTFGDGISVEKPVHEACVSDFSIGKYEVTQGQWQKVMGSNPSYFSSCGDNCPVEQVSWDDVQEYIRKLKQQTGISFRLPTEAEWEYAARSGGKAEKYSGGSDVGVVAWYSSNSGSITHPVGQKQPNGLGIYDMSGNVFEWVSDWYGNYSASRQQDPTGPSTGSVRVNRGGSWYLDAEFVRTAIRCTDSSDYRIHNLGFRLVSPVRGARQERKGGGGESPNSKK